MKYLSWYIKLRGLTLKNMLWKDTKTRTKTLFLFSVIIGFIYGFTQLIYRFIFKDMLLDMHPSGLIILFFYAVVWIYLSSFVQSLSQFIKSFLNSPEMNYFMTLPIPSGHLFLFKFIDHIFQQMKSSLFLFIPFLAAIGMGFSASWLYYILIIPIYALITVIPSVLGVMIALYAIRFISIKRFSLITSTLSFVLNIVFAFIIARSSQFTISWMLSLIQWMEQSILSQIIPFSAGINLFYDTITKGQGIISWISMIVFSLLFVMATFLLSKHLYVVTWSINQDVTSDFPKKKNFKKVTIKKGISNPMRTWITHEWKMAIRNHEMIIGSIFMLLFFFGTLVYLVISKPFINDPLVGLFILITVAVIFNVIAVSIVFIPVEIATDKTVWKKRYWILKILPVKSFQVFTIQMVMYVIPTLIISFSGVIIYMISHHVELHIGILVLLFLVLASLGSTAIYISFELLALTEYFENHVFVASIMTLVLPILYGILSSGIFILLMDTTHFITSNWPPLIQNLLSIEYTIIISLGIIILTLWGSKKIFNYAWNKIEM